MTSRTTERFRRADPALRERVRVQAREAHCTFVRDRQHPELRPKPVQASRPIYSARVGFGSRSPAVREGDAWVWFCIGSHAEYARLIAGL